MLGKCVTKLLFENHPVNLYIAVSGTRHALVVECFKVNLLELRSMLKK